MNIVSGQGRALVVIVDKYQFRPTSITAKSTGRHVSQTFRRVLDYQTEVLWGNQIARPEILYDRIRHAVDQANACGGQFVFYFVGRGEELVRDGETRSYLALPNFLPRRTKSSIPLDRVLAEVHRCARALVVIDAPVAKVHDLANMAAVSSLTQYSCRAILSGIESAATTSGAHISPFSLSFDRAVRRAADSNGHTSASGLAEQIRTDLSHLLSADTVGVFGAPDYSELAVDGTIGNLGYDDWSYLVGNIYNWSTGSRGDGANDLHYLYENATEPQLRKFARERLDYLAETEPDPQLRYYVSDILHKECTSSAINVDSLLEIELVPHPVSLISVSGGEFLMGTNDTRFNTAERPQHVLNLQSFQISRTLITVGQFAEYIRATGAAIPRNWESVDWVVSHIDHPVTSVTWHEAYFFCAWLQEKLRAYDLIRSDDYVRLPTEAEWEKAARGTDGRLYPWGEDFDYRKCNTKTAGLRSTTPVGLFSPQGDSPYGCADMVGNAREWTCSLWGTAGNIPSFRYPYTIADGRDLISAPDSVRRVIRGGGYYYDDDCANCVVRNRAFAHNRHAAGGFRIVVSGRMLR